MPERNNANRVRHSLKKPKFARLYGVKTLYKFSEIKYNDTVIAA